MKLGNEIDHHNDDVEEEPRLPQGRDLRKKKNTLASWTPGIQSPSENGNGT